MDRSPNGSGVLEYYKVSLYLPPAQRCNSGDRSLFLCRIPSILKHGTQVLYGKTWIGFMKTGRLN